ncbi:hypothetical protein WA1_00815 [Scytonema hofmannii PCC 7110]|uniref:HTH araC/xylS-type domain-containing protein n=1 Tax=Scytonema hofmannii PCC 7110 TaxID=128403 RepID=A0A139XGC2_9CYAN|nr:helix-turn-helix transcriptional regulator [Scytonema hofmannii]KYC43738.1 hypothetical protein WA1_00815 [Scytonema hofmannii PCC 7110]
MQAEHLLRSANRDSTTSLRYQAVERVILAMHNYLDQTLSLEDMAEIATLSPYHFNRIFHQVTGIPPSQFLYALRLETAKRLLLTTQLSVTEVCYEVGYNSLGTFVTRFKQLVGLSPSHLRRFAKHFTLSCLEQSDKHLTFQPRVIPLNPSLTGRIVTSDAFTGLIFIGLFSTPIPQNRPICCTLLTAPGLYRIAPVPDGCYYVFAAAIANCKAASSYLLQEIALHGCVGPLVVCNGQVNKRPDILLRPKLLTDPPILTALSFLFAERWATDTNS